jgi:small subunit ribosomal protein S6
VPQNLYETMYIIRPDLGDDLTDQAIAKYESILKEQGVTELEIQHRGKRRLAYEINRYREGIYVQMNYRSGGAAIAILERAMRLNDDVIRYLTTRQQEPVPEEVEEAVEA